MDFFIIFWEFIPKFNMIKIDFIKMNYMDEFINKNPKSYA